MRGLIVAVLVLTVALATDHEEEEHHHDEHHQANVLYPVLVGETVSVREEASVTAETLSEVDLTLQEGTGIYAGEYQTVHLFLRPFQNNVTFELELVDAHHAMIGLPFDRHSGLEKAHDHLEVTAFTDLVLYMEEEHEGHEDEAGFVIGGDDDDDHAGHNHGKKKTKRKRSRRIKLTKRDEEEEGNHTDHEDEDGDHDHEEGEHGHGHGEEEEEHFVSFRFVSGGHESEVFTIHLEAGHHHIERPEEEILSLFGATAQNHLNFTQYEEAYEHVVSDGARTPLGVEIEEDDGHNHDHDHDHGRRSLKKLKKKNKKAKKTSRKGLSKRRALRVLQARLPKRQVLERQVGVTVPLCATPAEAFAAADFNSNGVLDPEELNFALSHMFVMFNQMCFVQDCNRRPTTAEAWGYGFLSVIIISLLSLLAVILLPVRNEVFKTYILVTMVAFAFGAIVGDSLFHIIPNLMGLHSHGAGPTVNYFWLLAVVAGTFLIFFLIERVIHFLHDHVSAQEDSQGDLAKDLAESTTLGRGMALPEPRQTESMESAESGSSEEEKKGGKRKMERTKWNAVEAMGWLALVSDAFHNFVDGLALGAAWSTSLPLGLGTSIAIFCHEVPQELGDFAVLVEAGLSRGAALMWNLISALPAILGLCIAIPVSEATGAQPWFLAITAGAFLYIGFGTLIPELMKPKGFKLTVASLIAMCVGFVILIILAVYEDQMLFAFCF